MEGRKKQSNNSDTKMWHDGKFKFQIESNHSSASITTLCIREVKNFQKFIGSTEGEQNEVVVKQENKNNADALLSLKRCEHRVSETRPSFSGSVLVRNWQNRFEVGSRSQKMGRKQKRIKRKWRWDDRDFAGGRNGDGW